jgi:hypothetical protein
MSEKYRSVFSEDFIIITGFAGMFEECIPEQYNELYAHSPSGYDRLSE